MGEKERGDCCGVEVELWDAPLVDMAAKADELNVLLYQITQMAPKERKKEKNGPSSARVDPEEAHERRKAGSKDSFGHKPASFLPPFLRPLSFLYFSHCCEDKLQRQGHLSSTIKGGMGNPLTRFVTVSKAGKTQPSV